MSYEITGTVHHVGDTQRITDTFEKRELVLLTTNGQYENYAKLEFTGDRTMLLDGILTGAAATVHFDIRGREYQDRTTGEPRYFTSLHGWKITQGAGTGATGQPVDPTPAPAPPSPAPAAPAAPAPAYTAAPDEQLPF